jgi:hypothetical protein
MCADHEESSPSRVVPGGAKRRERDLAVRILQLNACG